MIIVSNAGPLIALAKISQLPLLQALFEELVIPEEVHREIVVRGKGKPGAEMVARAEWIKVKRVSELGVAILATELDLGEAEAIILAKELNAELLLLDEKIPRELAKSLGLKVAGTLAIIHAGLQRGLLEGELGEFIQQLKRKGVWLSEEVVEEARQLKP
jgi:predicted nucleic acid-binding protein